MIWKRFNLRLTPSIYLTDRLNTSFRSKFEAFDQSVLQQALDIVKHSKVGNLLVGEERRKSAKTSRRGSRESLEMSYDGDEVGDGA